MRAIEIYQGSDGEATKRFYASLESTGPVGRIAMNLFRAQKCSARAKVYRGGNGRGSYRGMAYDRKNWSMEQLCAILLTEGEGLAVWGWKLDPAAAFHSWVLYVDLPELGQVSFHAAMRGEGPDYTGQWDGQHKSAERIIQFCDRVLGMQSTQSLFEAQVA